MTSRRHQRRATAKRADVPFERVPKHVVPDEPAAPVLTEPPGLAEPPPLTQNGRRLFEQDRLAGERPARRPAVPRRQARGRGAAHPQPAGRDPGRAEENAMTDQQHADNIRAKVSDLNAAIDAAYEAGIRVTRLGVTETALDGEVATRPTVVGPAVIGRPL
jgi:hypothetical protein